MRWRRSALSACCLALGMLSNAQQQSTRPPAAPALAVQVCPPPTPPWDPNTRPGPIPALAANEAAWIQPVRAGSVWTDVVLEYSYRVSLREAGHCDVVLAAPPGRVVSLLLTDATLDRSLPGEVIEIRSGDSAAAPLLARYVSTALASTQGQVVSLGQYMFVRYSAPNDCLVDASLCPDVEHSSWSAVISYEIAGCMLDRSLDFNVLATVQPTVSSIDDAGATAHVYGTCGASGSASICNSFCQSSDCNALTEQSGRLTDGSFPLMSGYIRGLDCTRRIRTSEGQTLQLHFLEADLGQHDVITVSDPHDLQVSVPVAVLDHTTRTQIVVHSVSNELLVHFQTSSSLTGRGWLADWTAGKGGCLDTESPDYDPSAQFQPYGACGQAAARSVCVGLKHAVSSTAVVVRSPSLAGNLPARATGVILGSVARHGFIDGGNGAQNYINGLDCGRAFSTHSGEGLSLHFSVVNLGFGDRVYVYAGNSSSDAATVLELLPQSIAPVTIVIDANIVIVKFVTTAMQQGDATGAAAADGTTQTRISDTGIGFRAEFQFGVLGCTDVEAVNFNPDAEIYTDTCDHPDAHRYALCAEDNVKDSLGVIHSSAVDATVAPRHCQRDILLPDSHVEAPDGEVFKLNLDLTLLATGDVIALYEEANSSQASLRFFSEEDRVYVCSDIEAPPQNCGGQCLAALVYTLEYEGQLLNDDGQVCDLTCVWDGRSLEWAGGCLVDRSLDFYSTASYASLAMSTTPAVSGPAGARSFDISWKSGPAGCTAGTYSRHLEGRSQLRSELEGGACSQCPHTEACLGNNECGTGYEGSWCAACATGIGGGDRYFSFRSSCRRCPSDRFWFLYVVLLCMMFVLFAYTMLSFSKQGRVLAMGAASILFSHTQLTAQMLSMDVGWPPFFRLAMEWLADLFSLNLPDMAAPECVMDFHSSGAAYLFRLTMSGLMLPTVAVLIYSTHLFTAVLPRCGCFRRVCCCFRGPRDEDDEDEYDYDDGASFAYANSAFISAFSTLYVSLVGSALRTLFCVEVEGMMLLDGNRAIVCLEQGTTNNVVELIAKIAVILTAVTMALGWSLGRLAVIPSMFLFVTVSFMIVISDLASDGVGVEVPWEHLAYVGVTMVAFHAIAFPFYIFWNIHDAGPPPFDRKAIRQYGWFISRFRSDKYYYEFLLMARKFCVMIVTTFFSSNETAVVAWSACACIIIASWICHRRMMPWADTGYAPVLFRRWSLNDLEEASLGCMAASMTLASYFVFFQEVKGDSSTLTVSIASLILLLNVAMLVLAAWLWLEGRFNPHVAEAGGQHLDDDELDQQERMNRAPASWSKADKEAQFFLALRARQDAALDITMASPVRAVEVSPTDMRVSAPVSPSKSRGQQIPNTGLVVVEFAEEGALGIAFNGKTPPTITKLLADGLASEYTKIQPGLILRTVQDEGIAHLDYKEALQFIKSSGRPLRLGFERPIGLKRVPLRQSPANATETVANPTAASADVTQNQHYQHFDEMEKLRGDVAELASTIEFLQSETGGDNDNAMLVRLIREHSAMVQQLSMVDSVDSLGVQESEELDADPVPLHDSHVAALDAWLDSGILAPDDHPANSTTAPAAPSQRPRHSMTFDDTSSEEEQSSETESGTGSQPSQMSETALQIKMLRERNRIERQLKRQAEQEADMAEQEADMDNGDEALSEEPMGSDQQVADHPAALVTDTTRDAQHARHLQYFLDVFDLYDVDGDGTISASDLGSLLRTLGHELTEEELEAERHGLNLTEASSIGHHEVMSLFTQLQTAREQVQADDVNEAKSARKAARKARKVTRQGGGSAGDQGGEHPASVGGRRKTKQRKKEGQRQRHKYRRERQDDDTRRAEPVTPPRRVIASVAECVVDDNDGALEDGFDEL